MKSRDSASFQKRRKIFCSENIGTFPAGKSKRRLYWRTQNIGTKKSRQASSFGAAVMQLLVLLLLLVAPYLILTLWGRWINGFKLSPAARARVGLSLFFLFTGIGHFIRTKEMAEMVPSSLPYRFEVIYITGVLELLGAIGVWIPRMMRL